MVTFGEIMMRFQRLSQTRTFEVTYGGGEANVAISLANLGLDVDFVTRLVSVRGDYGYPRSRTDVLESRNREVRISQMIHSGF